MKGVRWSAVIWLFVVSVTSILAATPVATPKKPNVVILVADDLGVGDVGCYGNKTMKTPNIDRLAKEGARLTHHLAAAAMCTPSRAALLTARYPARYGLVGEPNTPAVIVHVASRVGLPLSEVTLATALKEANYTTAAIGKWHLGQGCELGGRHCEGPQGHGFESFYGIPFTLVEVFKSSHPFFIFPLDGSDPFYQVLVTLWVIFLAWALWARWRLTKIIIYAILLAFPSTLCWFLHTHYRFHTQRWWQVSPWMDLNMNGILMDNDQVSEQPIELEGLSQRLVKRSVDFINQHANDPNPFFLYHSFAHVHTPMFTAKGGAGRSVHGRYGDNVEEMDDGVGAILDALDQHKLTQNTIVYFVSDNGGHLEAVADEDGQRIGGYNGKFKGGKCQGGSEGGIRVPGIYRWNNHIPAGVTLDSPTSLLDTLPTILELVGLPPLNEHMPNIPERELDGMSIAEYLTKGRELESRSLLHHCGRDIHAVRLVFDKLIYKMHVCGYKWDKGSTQCGLGTEEGCSCFDVDDYGHLPELYDLNADPYEDNPIPQNSSKYFQVTGVMKQFLAEWKARVEYPPSQYKNKFDTMHSILLQPFRKS